VSVVRLVPSGSTARLSLDGGVLLFACRTRLLDEYAAIGMRELELKVQYKQAQRERLALLRRLKRLPIEAGPVRPAVDEAGSPR
jgi:hypothetical protein